MKNEQNLDYDFKLNEDEEIDGFSDMSYEKSPFESQEDYEERMENLNSFLEHFL